jgi:hypothetical protein
MCCYDHNHIKLVAVAHARFTLKSYLLLSLSPSQRRRAPFRVLARGEGTNSARLFTPGERNALAKSKVHQISWAHGNDPRAASSLISKIWLFARSGISTLRILKQDFNFQKHLLATREGKHFNTHFWAAMVKHALLFSFSMKLY